MSNEEVIVELLEKQNIILEQQNILLTQLIETLEQQPAKRATVGGGGRGSKNRVTEQMRDYLEPEIDIDWWFTAYGEEPLPAKYMAAEGGFDPNAAYKKDEGEYIFSRLLDYVEETNKQGTHEFKYLGKVWCPRERNARNCFAFVPVRDNG